MTLPAGLFLAVDQSTSATKAMLFTTEGRLLDQEMLSHRQIYPQPGWVEHDADAIFDNTLAVSSNLLKRHSEERKNLLALSITNQRETFVVFDRETGRPLHNAIVWQCTRGERNCRLLTEAGYGDLVQQRTGLRIDTYFPASKMQWLLENDPDIARLVSEGRALIGTMDAYLIYRLTDGHVFATDHTNASRTLIYDIHRLAWDADLAALFGVPLSVLPEIRSCDAPFGETDLGGMLPAPIPIYGVMGDSQASLFAQRCYASGSAKVTFGTGSSILLNIGSQPRPVGQGIVTAVAWVLASMPTYALEGIVNFTGATIQWLRDQLGLIQSVQEVESLATSVRDNAGVYLVPAFLGLSAPYWRPDARAAILGLTPAATRAHVARAALEAIAYIVHDVLQHMKDETGLKLTAIHADGGATRNRFLMQFVADVTGLTVRAAQTPELSALGAVFAGMLGKGICTSLRDLEKLPGGFVEYCPSLPPDQVETLVSGWERAVRQVLG
jgi:glycerol kinase